MIQLAVPNLTGKEAEYTAQAIANGYIGPGGPFMERFEELVAKASGRKWAVAVLTGTAALHATAHVLGYRGRGVFVPEDAFPAARNVFREIGCAVEFGEGGENHDAAVYRAHYAAEAFADRAPAIGEPPFAECIAETYSFAANKIVTCGHGGAVVGDEKSFEAAVRSVIRQGRNRSGIFNYRMADSNAAIGCAQMERLDELKAAKRRIWQRYVGAGLPMMERGASRWMATTTLKLDIAKLADMGIEAREECGGVSLPCSTGITEAELDRVIKAALRRI